MGTEVSERAQQAGRDIESSDTSQRRLTFVIYSPFPSYSGGRENWLRNVMGQLDKQGYTITVYAYESDEPPFYDLSDLRNARVVQVPTLRRRTRRFRLANRLTLNLAFWLDAWIFARRTYRRLRDDWRGGPVIAMNPIIDLLPALWLKGRRREARVGCSVRGLVAWELSLTSPLTGRFLPWAGPLLRWFERRSLAQCDLVLANGYDTQDHLGTRGITSTVVPNGIDVARFACGGRDLPETEPLRRMKAAGRAIVMMVATLRDLKGICELLEAARGLKEKSDQRFTVVFVGKGEQGRYRRKMQSLALEDYVWFAGEQREIPSFLGLADVSVNLSSGAGMPMATLESMAAGKAIVAWNTPVYRQIIENGRTGILINEGDAEALAGQLSLLLDDPARRQALGSAGQAQAEAYDWSAVTRRFLGAFQSTEGMSGT